MAFPYLFYCLWRVLAPQHCAADDRSHIAGASFGNLDIEPMLFALINPARIINIFQHRKSQAIQAALVTDAL